MTSIKHKLTNLIAIICLTAFYGNAQNIQFEELKPDFYQTDNIQSFIHVSESASASADVDNDGDLDVLIAGKSNQNQKTTQLYLNNGSGFFAHATDMFTGLINGDLAFFDFDNDGDQDLIIVGEAQLNRQSLLYENDGSGNFTEVSAVVFIGVDNSSVATADVDGNGYADVFLSGTASSGRVSLLYLNDGAGSFTVQTGTPFDHVKNGDSAFGDVDGDNDQDLVISGYNGSAKITKLYLNDGSGNFTEATNFTVEGVWFGELALFDSDADNDLDLIVTGRNASNAKTALLYENDGTGVYTELSTANDSLVGVDNSNISIGDIDNDNDLDIFIAGLNTNNETDVNFYINDGNGVFQKHFLFPQNYLYGLISGSSVLNDFNGDSRLDIILSGENNDLAMTGCFFNDSTGILPISFFSTDFYPFQGVFDGVSIFSDIDNDSDMDLYVAGRNNWMSWSDLFVNDGTGNFSKSEIDIKFLHDPTATFADFNNDNHVDLIAAGIFGQNICNVYFNDGAGVFTESTSNDLYPLWMGEVSVEDIDNDNDLDIITVGYDQVYYARFAYKYINDGSGNFTEVPNNFQGISDGSISFADVDGDNDSDVLIAGRVNNSGSARTYLYINDGIGTFTLDNNTSFENIRQGGSQFADMDGDGDQDLLINGLNVEDGPYGDTYPIVKLYINDGLGSFTEDSTVPFYPTGDATINAFDADNDGDLEVLITGKDDNDALVCRLYENDGLGNFDEVENLPFEPVSESSVDIADINGDQKLDIIITGKNSINQSTTRLYKNISTISSQLSENKIEHQVKIMPNPSEGRVLIKSGHPVAFEVCDMNGRIITTNMQQKTEHLLDLSGYPKGVYMVRCISDAKVSVESLILE